MIKLFPSSKEMLDVILKDKAPFFKNEDDAYLIIDSPSITMQHPILDVNINEYVSLVLESKKKSCNRSKPLFALVTGIGRGKTRMLVELKRSFNKKENVLCVAITFNGNWGSIIMLPDALESHGLDLRYSVNIVARILSMCYHLSLSNAADLDLDITTTTPSDLIRECILYIVNQYRLIHPMIDMNQFVLLVDESLAIQTTMDSKTTMIVCT